MSFKSPEKIKNMFDTIAVKYDCVNNIISLGLHKHVKKLSVKLLDLDKNMNILDLCTGTGDIAKFIKLKKPDVEVYGVDFSDKMIEIANKKNDCGVKYILGDCLNLPFEDSSFDVVTIAFGLRNIEDSKTAIEEIKRVLKNGGYFLHLDFDKKSKVADFVFKMIIKYFVKLFYNKEAYEYLLKSKQEFYSSEELVQIFKNNGFEKIKVKNYLTGIISAQVMRKL